MSWDTLAALDQNDTAVRERTREDQVETVDFLADLVAHLYMGLQQRSRFPIVGDAPEWAAAFLAHAAGALHWAFKQLLNGYYAHAIGSLRNVLEDASVVAYLSLYPDEAAKFTAMRERLEEYVQKDTVKTGPYRTKLAALEGESNQALVAGMRKAQEMMKALHQYGHPSLFALELVRAEDGVSTAGYYSAEGFRQAAYMFVGTFHYVAEAAHSLIGESDPKWTAKNIALVQQSAKWIARANKIIGASESPGVNLGRDTVVERIIEE